MDDRRRRGDRARRGGVSRAARPGLLRHGLDGRGPRRAGARAAGRRRPRDHAPADQRRLIGVAGGPAYALPELASVYWREPMDERRLVRRGRLWTLTTVAHVVPFLLTAAALMYLQPLAFAVAAICVAHAWIIPALYAQRGANVVRPKSRAGAAAEGVSIGLLGDLVGHQARDLH